MSNFKKGAIISGAIFIIVIIFLFSSISVINPGYAGVVYSINGGVRDDVLTQGWHFVLPGKKVIEYPVATETVYFSKNNDEGADGDTSLNVSTADGKMVNMDVSYTYHYDIEQLPAIFTKFKGQNAGIIADTYIRRELKDALNSVTSKYGVFEIYGTQRSEVSAEAFVVFKDKVSNIGIIIEGLSITEVNPDGSTMKAIQDKVDAIQALEKAKIERDKEKILAEQKIIAAQAEADATLIKAKTEAEANQIIRKSISRELIDYEKWSKWDGKLPAVMSDSNAIIDLREKTD